MSLYDLPPRTCKKCGAEFTRRRGEKPASFTARNRCDDCKPDNKIPVCVQQNRKYDRQTKLNSTNDQQAGEHYDCD